MKGICVPLRLHHCRPEIKVLHPLTFDMDTGKSHKVRRIPEGHRLPRRDRKPRRIQYTAKLQLSAPAFALGGPPHYPALRSL
jgi:hypothetical protein